MWSLAQHVTDEADIVCVFVCECYCGTGFRSTKTCVRENRVQQHSTETHSQVASGHARVTRHVSQSTVTVSLDSRISLDVESVERRARDSACFCLMSSVSSYGYSNAAR